MKSVRISLLTIALLSLGAAEQLPAQSLRHEILAAHNKARARVGVPQLTWSSSLAALAQQWADSLLSNGKFVHRPKPRYGENLFEIRGGKASASEVVTSWVDEARDYNSATGMCRKGVACGHFTQVVWRSTKQVGCAVARNAKREVWVCNYDLPGNWVGQKPF